MNTKREKTLRGAGREKEREKKKYSETESGDKETVGQTDREKGERERGFFIVLKYIFHHILPIDFCYQVVKQQNLK